jgi:excinuclease UvrABC helicase subunit UvrB
MLEEQMREAAIAMDFELAAQLRDQLFEVRARATGAPVKGRAAVGASRSGR